MKRKAALLLIAIILAIFTSCDQKKEDQPAVAGPEKYDLKIAKINDLWSVINTANLSKEPLKVKKNDHIYWAAEGTDAYIQFPDTLLKPIGNGNQLVNGYTAHLVDGEILKLQVKNTAPVGEHVYAVFCMADSVYAEGDSPPKFILE